MLKLNFCVVFPGDGGELAIQDFSEYNLEDICERGDEDEDEYGEDGIFASFAQGLAEGEWGSEVTLEAGLAELYDYFQTGGREEYEVEEFEKLKKDFVNQVENKIGKFYLWGVEYDCDLMFIEE